MHCKLPSAFMHICSSHLPPLLRKAAKEPFSPALPVDEI
jgi:hypothetical protein